MKNKPLFQFSLTAICSMVLVACGGGSSNPTTQATNTTPETNAPTTTPATTATTPTTTSEVANAVSNETTDKQKLTAEASATPFIGYKHVSKTNSRFVINETEGGDNGADTPVGMNIQNPNRSFDTLVVAEPVLQEEGKPAKIGYLEDFDFRKDQVNYNNNQDDDDDDGDEILGGVMTFQARDAEGGIYDHGIYLAQASTSADLDADEPVSAERADEDKSKAGIGNTKTATRGLEINATALVYDGVDKDRHKDVDNNEVDHNRGDKSNLLQNYTDTHFTPHTMASVERKTDGSVKYNADGTVNIDAETSEVAGILSRSQLNRVGGYLTVEAQDAQAEKVFIGDDVNVVTETSNIAEVYGYRTFASPEQYTGTVTDLKANNLPLENKQLTKVQYGRVTSHLAEHTSFNDFKKGVLQTPAIESYVVDYGGFGADGTEDHYFYRGVDGITSAQLSDLQAKGGILKYWGHAVSYGLNNKWDGSEVSAGAPTAIGANSNARFVSGNHAHAWVNMANGDVGGAIYNTWVVPTENDPTKGNLKAVNMVEFEGKLAANGNIAGTSKLAYDPSSTGVFGANLYGSQAQEMGGVVASHDKMPYKKWGAVFGAIRTSSSEIQNATNRGL